MITILEQIEDDELFASWFSDMMEENGAVSRQDKERYLYAITGDEAYIQSQHTMLSSYTASICKISRSAEGSALFPKIEDILRWHTDLYAMLPFWEKGTQAQRFDYVLEDQDIGNNAFNGTPRQTARKVCPICAKKDMEEHGRLVIHVPHMLHVNACWEHGCRLVGVKEWKSDPVPATKQEIKKAVFMHDLYMDPAVTYYEQMCSTLKASLDKEDIVPQEAIRKAKEARYLDPKFKTTRFLKTGYQSCESYYPIYIAVLAWLYGTAEKFKAELPEWDPADEYTRDTDMDLLHCDGPLAKFRCRVCGNEFYMHPVSAQYGTPCPVCRKRMSEVDVVRRYAEYLDDGDYLVDKDDDGKIHVVHEECMTDRTARFGRIVHNKIKCEKCRARHEAEAHIGEYNWNTYGFYMEIIGGENICNLDIKFGDGEIVHNRSYNNFLKGSVKSRKDGKLMSERIGDENINKYGLHMKVIAYRQANDIDVEFDDGTVVEHRTYKDFQEGNIGYPGYQAILRQEERVGQEMVNYQGIKMKITEYRSADDITVEFETGETVHSKYDQFRRGRTKCPSAFRHQERVGEEGYNNQGAHMVIIRYGNAEDVDIMFDNGEIAYHKKYANFKSGKIGTQSLAEERLGEEGVNTQGLKMTIVGYVNNQNVDVGFENGYIAYGKTYKAFKEGLIACRDPQMQDTDLPVNSVFDNMKEEGENDL